MTSHHCSIAPQCLGQYTHLEISLPKVAVIPHHCKCDLCGRIPRWLERKGDGNLPNASKARPRQQSGTDIPLVPLKAHPKCSGPARAGYTSSPAHTRALLRKGLSPHSQQKVYLQSGSFLFRHHQQNSQPAERGRDEPAPAAARPALAARPLSLELEAQKACCPKAAPLLRLPGSAQLQLR